MQNVEKDTKSKTSLPLINILTRSGKREQSFLNLKKSILEQSYKNIRHIISCDDPKCNFLKDQEVVYVKKEPKKGKCFYNLYLNKLAECVNDGWVLILDDDSKLINKQFLEKLSHVCLSTEPNKVIYYQAKWNRRGTILPRKINMAKPLLRGDIDMVCFCAHHSVFRTFKFTGRCAGDFNFLTLIHKSKHHKLSFCKNLPIGIHANYNGPRNGK